MPILTTGAGAYISSGVDTSLYLVQDDATLVTQDDSTQITVN